LSLTVIHAAIRRFGNRLLILSEQFGEIFYIRARPDGLFRQCAYLIGHHGETPAGLPRPRGFDGALSASRLVCSAIAFTC